MYFRSVTQVIWSANCNVTRVNFHSYHHQIAYFSIFLTTNCDICFFLSFSDLKLHLQGTDYGQFLANEPSPLSVSVIDDKLREKLVIEFQHLRNHAVEPLSTFLDFITYSYMIDNIILLITGTLHQRPISELIPKCHPLGSFEQMEAIHVAANPAELYNAVLVDTPLAPFFVDCISEQDLDEMNIEIIRNTLYKAYLEAFYEFCAGIGGTTAEVMCEILAVSCNGFWIIFLLFWIFTISAVFLQFEADRRAIIITINSFGTELSKDDRSKLYPRCGKMNPDGLAALARADDYEQVKAVAEYYAEYAALFNDSGNNPGDKTLEDKFFEHEVRFFDFFYLFAKSLMNHLFCRSNWMFMHSFNNSISEYFTHIWS